jgi:hypothetical protein
MAKWFTLSVLIFGLALARPVSAANFPEGEWVIVVGGVSMHQWEKYKAQPHDHWWANFVHAARIRTEQLRSQLGCIWFILIKAATSLITSITGSRAQK